MVQRKAVKGRPVDPKFWETADPYQALARKDKAAKLQQAFIDTDTDGSGAIDSNELWALLIHAFPEYSTKVLQVYYDVLLRECDVDHDGMINYSEFAAEAEQSGLMQQLIDETEKAESLEKAFREIDRDGSGQLEMSELQDVLALAFPEAPATTREKFVRAIMADCDRDYSGTITLDEFLRSDYIHLLSYTGMGGRDMDAEKQVARAGRKAFRATRKGATKGGVKGGIDARCDPTSPRRRQPPECVLMLTNGGGSGGGSGGSPQKGAAGGGRATSPTKPVKLPPVQRLEENNFVPQGFEGVVLHAKGELELDNHAAPHQWNDAKEYFVDAGDQYTREGNYAQAGEAYVRAADCLCKLGQPLESADMLSKAAEAYALCKPQEAIDCINEALEVYEDFERLKTVARLHKRIAELAEGMGNYYDAIGYYLEAADLYGSDANITLRAQCLRKVAQLHAQSGQYKEAIGMFEDLANMTMANNAGGNPVFGRLVVKEFFFRAVLCHLANADQSSGIDRLAGIEKAKRAFDKYADLDLDGFNTGAEFILAKQLIEAEFAQNLPVMQKAIRHYQENRAVDPVVTGLVKKIQADLEAWLEKVGEGI